MARRKILLILLASVIGLISIQSQADDSIAWRHPLPGTKAYLGAEPGSTLCNTPKAWYRSYLTASDETHGCKTFKPGLPVIIKGVQPLQGVYTEGSYLIAKVYVPAKHYTGYIWVTWIHPDIPAGTIVHYTIAPAGNSVHLVSDPANYDPFSGIELKDATAKVLKLDPANDSLYVTILDGPHAGATGWTSLTFGQLIQGADGTPLDEFLGQPWR